MATDIRLRIPEAFAVHQHMVDWTSERSSNGIPAGALGLDPIALKLMRWAMEDFRRLDFVNRHLAGTAVPQVALDLLPGLSCSAHFILSLADGAGDASSRESWLAAGVAMQRIWLTADALGLALQPSFAPLVFAHCARHDERFTVQDEEQDKSSKLAAALQRLMGDVPTEEILLFARIGTPRGPRPTTRSIRKPLSELVASAGVQG